MKFFSRLFGENRPDDVNRLLPGDYDFDIVGEASYQQELEAIVGCRDDDSAEYMTQARLLPEPTNPYDENAICVTIEGKTIGYLSRKNAVEYHRRIGSRPTICDAMIIGGWERGKRGQGHFGVKLDIAWPPKLET